MERARGGQTHTHTQIHTPTSVCVPCPFVHFAAAFAEVVSNEALSLRHHQQNPDETRFLFDFTFFLRQLRGRPGAEAGGRG